MPIDAKAEAHFIKLIKQLLTDLEPISADNVEELNRGSFQMFTRRGISINLFGRSYETFAKALSALKKLKFATSHSDEHLEESLKDALAAILLQPAQTDQLILDLLHELDTSPPHFKAIIPFFGIELKVPDFKVGRVLFATFSKEAYEDLTSKLSRIVDTMRNSAEQKDAFLQMQKQDLSHLINATIAQVEVDGDTELSVSRAEHECRTARDYLQLIDAMFDTTDLKVRVDFERPQQLGMRPRILVARDLTQIHINHYRFGPYANLVLTEERVKRLGDVGLSELADILGRPERSRTEIEDMLTQSVHWFANGEIQDEPENKLLSYVTCLDMFFSIPGTGDTARSVSEGVAFLLGKDKQWRLEIYETVKEAYDRRSSASHSGTRLEDLAIIPKIRILALNVIGEMVKRRDAFPNRAGIREWLLDMRLS
jgi:hypothetical protein